MLRRTPAVPCGDKRERPILSHGYIIPLMRPLKIHAVTPLIIVAVGQNKPPTIKYAVTRLHIITNQRIPLRFLEVPTDENRQAVAKVVLIRSSTRGTAWSPRFLPRLSSDLNHPRNTLRFSCSVLETSQLRIREDRFPTH